MARLLIQIHRYLGLVTLAFLVLAGATGSVLCFDKPLDALLNPQLFQARGPGARQAPLAVAAALERRDPRLMLTQVPMETPPGQTVQVKASSWPGHAPLGFEDAFVDPATLSVQGVRTEAPGWDRAHLIRGVYFLHYTLLAGDPGRWFMAVVALGWLANTLVGFYLTLPSGGSFWRRWAPVWGVNFKARLPRLLLDLHRASGLWLFAALTVVAFTSVALNSYSEVFEPLATALSPSKPAPWDRPAPTVDPHRKPRLDFVAAERAALGFATHDGVKLRPAAMTYDGARGLYGLRLTSDGRLDWKGLGPVSYYVDDQAGRLVYVDDPLSDSGGQRFLRSLYPLHSGDVGGLATKLLVCLVGLATVEMSGSGLYVWWKKRKPRVAARAAKRAARRIDRVRPAE